MITDPDEVYVTYRDERAEWAQALPALQRLRDEKGWRYLAEASGLSERALRFALNGGTVPHREARERLAALSAEALEAQGSRRMDGRSHQALLIKGVRGPLSARSRDHSARWPKLGAEPRDRRETCRKRQRSLPSARLAGIGRAPNARRSQD